MRTILAALLLTTLTACGSSAPAADPEVTFKSMDDAALTLGCTKYAKSDPMLFASETASCTGRGAIGDVTINFFNNDKARDQYVKAGTSAGAVYVEGKAWVVECTTRTQQKAVVDSTGGVTKG